MTHKIWYGLSLLEINFNYIKFRKTDLDPCSVRVIPSLRPDNCYCNTEVSVKSTGSNGRLGIMIMGDEDHSLVVEATTLSSIKIDKEVTVEAKRDIYKHKKGKFTIKYCISPPPPTCTCRQ